MRRTHVQSTLKKLAVRPLLGPFAAITDIIAKGRFSLQLDDLSVSSKVRLSQKRAGFFYVFVCAERTEYLKFMF